MRIHHHRHHHVLLVLIFLTTTACLSIRIRTCNALATSSQKAVVVPPDLIKLAPRLYGNKLNYRIAIGDKQSPFQIQNLHIQLSNQCQQQAQNPSSDSKKLSTGIHDATVLQNPYYVNNNGQQTVLLQNGGWQVQWSNHKLSPHGFLVCSFVSTKDYQRNDNDNNSNNNSKLEKGIRFYMYHRVWTRATLASERARRKAIQIIAAKAIRERDIKIQQYVDNTDNKNNNALLSKVTAYAQAAKYMQEYCECGIKEAMYIPLYDHQVLELSLLPDCIVSSRGLVYKMTTTGGLIGSSQQLEYMGESRVDLIKTTSTKGDEDIRNE